VPIACSRGEPRTDLAPRKSRPRSQYNAFATQTTALRPNSAPEFLLTLKKGEYEVLAESPDRGTVTDDTSADPRTMDIKGVEGPNKGKTFLAIYELKDGTLKICYDLSGESRPTEFKTKPDTKLFLVTNEWKRESD
jgi:uncharacterized protein (TIGR03067 family)